MVFLCKNTIQPQKNAIQPQNVQKNLQNDVLNVCLRYICVSY